jgi:hypothetical protein
MAVRLLLVVLMLVSLFMVIALRGHPLEANFQRILGWAVRRTISSIR